MNHFGQSSTSGAILAALLSAAIPVQILAQQPRRPSSGDRIRVEATTESGSPYGPTVGLYLRATADSVYFTHGDSIAAIHRLSVRTLEVGKVHHHAKAGAIIGAFVGVATLVVGTIAYCGQEDCDINAEYFLGVPVFAAPGAGLGALVGAAIPGAGPWVPGELPPSAPPTRGP